MRRGLVVACLVAAVAHASHAARPVVRAEQAADLEQGRASGMVVTRRGSLYAGPRIESFGSAFPVSEPAQVWAMTSDDEGNVYLGTGPEGRVYKITPNGETVLFFTADEPMVTALSVTRRGDLLAAAGPGGVIYLVGSDGRGEVWSETDELYVWALAPAGGGRFFAGTGERGRLLEIDTDGRVDLVFDSDEPHIVSLAPLPGGNVLAGGAGSGRVYRIDSEGHALVLHDDELAEVVALVAENDAVTVALLAPPEPEARQPVLRLRLPDGTPVGASPDAAPDVLEEEEAGPTVQGVIEGIPPPVRPEPARVRGRVLRIDAAGVATELWSSTREAPFCLLTDGQGRVFLGTGEPGRVYRVAPSGEVARLATLDEAQVTRLMTTRGGLLLSTANPARVYRLGGSRSQPGEFVSRPVDAGVPARWGSIRWSPPQAPSTEFYTRTGNSGRPDATWSAWSPALRDGSGSRIVNPDGRFLQWRVRQSTDGEEGTEISSVRLTYEPYNRGPRLEAFRVDPPGESTPGPVTFLWNASDPDGDPVRVTLEYRALARGRDGWRVLGETVSSEAGGRWVWQSEGVEEGIYAVRAVGTDQPGNPRGEGRTATSGTELRVVLDRTPPVIRLRAVDGSTASEVVVEDGLSDLRSLELVRDGEVRFTVRPEDGVCDSRREIFRFDLPGESAGRWSIRGTDAAGNAAEFPLGGEGEAD